MLCRLDELAPEVEGAGVVDQQAVKVGADSVEAVRLGG